MRTVSGPQLTLLNGATLNVYTRFEIKNASGTWKEFTNLGGKDYFISARLETNVDNPVWSLSASLKRDGELAAESLSPMRGDSTLNVDDALAPAPAINAAREWRVSVNVTAAGVSPAGLDWRELCSGYLDKPDFTADPMVIEGRSVGVRLMDTTIRVKRTYSGAFADVAQQIVNDNVPTPPTLYIPSPPSFTVTEYIPYQVSVMDALVTLALSTGWMVRDVYDPGSGTMKTGIIDPGRARSPDATMSPTVYRTVDGASLDTSTIRNVIEGEFVDGVTGEVLSITVTDPASIAAFGNIERYMKFSEDATSPIKSGNEMLDMVNAALSDLSTPKFDHVITSTLFWPAEIADLYTFTGNAVHYNDAQTLAVFGITHTLEKGHGATTLTCRGSPSGAFMEWIRRQGSGPIGPLVPPQTVVNWIAAEATQYGGLTGVVDGAIWIGYTLPAGVDEMRIHALLGDGPNLGVPSSVDPTTLAATIRRPEGDVGKSAAYGSIVILSTDENFYKRATIYSVRGGLTSQPVIAPTDGAIQAVDPSPLPLDGEVDSLTVTRSGSTNTVTVTPGLTEPLLGFNYVCIIRNKHILPPIPIGTSVSPVVFVDSGLEPSAAASYAYEAFIGNFGPTWFMSGGKRMVIVEAPVIDPPVFVNGTPIAAIVSNVQKVQIDWTGTTPGATGVRVEASLDQITVRTVGTGSLASGTVYDSILGLKSYRLVATNGATDVAFSRWVIYGGSDEGPVSNPTAVPEFVNGTPKIVFGTTFPTPTLVLAIEWRCQTAGAAYVRIMRSTTGSGGTYSMVPGGLSANVSNSAWKSPDATYITTDSWYKLQALAADGTTVLATSALVHWVPPA